MNSILKRIFSLLIIIAGLWSCSGVDKISESVEEIVPVNLDGKDSNIFGNKEYADAIVSQIVPQWYNVDDRFQLVGANGNISAHMFYDVLPDINSESYKVNFVVSTAQGSQRIINIDPLSGQHYTEKLLCEQNDIVGKYNEPVFEPPFTIGIIPRLLDQLGRPQKILVFGDKEYYRTNYRNNFFDVRIIGGYIEKVCQIGACPKLTDYSSRVVVLAVQAGNERYEKVRSIEDLRLVENWNEIRAFVENGFGKNNVAGTFYPAYRVGPELSALQTLTSIKQNSIYLTNKKLNQMRNSCYKLYDYVWQVVARPSKIEKQLAAQKDPQERTKLYRATKKLSNRFFHERFISAFRKFGDEYNTCAKFIYPSNILDNPRRHWFLAYYSAVHLLNDLGYTFDCRRSLWVKNPIMTDGKKSTKRNQEFQGCNARQIDMAFEFAVNYLDNLRIKNYPTYRYIDYDRHSFGTHEKLYSWVFQENKKLKCYGKNEDLVEKISTFPSDVKWVRRSNLLRSFKK